MYDFMTMPRWSKMHWLARERVNRNHSAELFAGVVGSIHEGDPFNIQMFWAELHLMSDAEVDSLFEDTLKRRADQFHETESQLDALCFYNAPDAFADVGFWARSEIWTIEEAIALSMNRSPDKVSSGRLESAHAADTIFAREYVSRLRLANRALAVGTLTDPVEPIVMIRWLQSKRLSIPDSIVESVTALNEEPADWREECIEQARLRLDAEKAFAEANRGHSSSEMRIVELSAELHFAHDRIESLEAVAAPEDEELNPKERTSLHKMLIAMAMKHYRYNPRAARNDATKTVQSTVENYGMKISEDTVRQHLRAACSVLDDAPDFR